VHCKSRLTDSREEAGDGVVVLVSNNLVLAEHTTTNALNDTDLGGLLIFKLPQAKGECAKLLDNL
jgi:hypothetical protein